MFFVEARYHKRSGSRRRPGPLHLTPRGGTDRRTTARAYGIGERYRALRGDEKAIRKAFRDDGRGLRNPVYFRFILTVDNPTAERFKRFDGHLSEHVLRDAVEKTFHGAARGAQGVFAVHQHGGHDRLAHPHVHALLSPRFENGMAVHISPVRIQRIKERWEREVLCCLARQERRLDRPREALAHTLLLRRRDRDERRSEHLLPPRAAPRREGQLEPFVTGRRSLPFARGNSWTRQWLLFGRRANRWEQNPEQAARRAVFRLASRAMPKPLRDLLWLSRSIHGIGLRQR